MRSSCSTYRESDKGDCVRTDMLQEFIVWAESKTIEAAAKERMEIIERQQQEIEKYRRESIFRPLRKLKALFGGRAG